jgi:type II secretory pathway component PulF
MIRFQYTALIGSGDQVTGQVRCADRNTAIRRVMEMGYHPVVVEPEGRNASAGSQISRWYSNVAHRINVRQLAVFTRQLASLLKAGIPLVQTLGTLSKQCESRRLKQVIEELEGTISRDASSFAEALEQHPRVFSPIYRGLVHAGEEGGNLTETLSDLASHLAQVAKLRGQVIGAFIYPIFLMILGTAAVFVLLSFVIPKFKALFASMGQELPLPTRVLIAVSGFFETWWWAVLLAFAGAITAGIVLSQREHVRRALDHRLLQAPVFGAMILKLELARVARSLAALLASGVPILQALQVTGSTAKNIRVRETFQTIRDDVATGEALADAFAKTGVYPPLVLNLISTGEETGELSEMLQELAAIYQDEADRAVEGAVKLLEPLLIVAMGLVIAGIVASVILPIFQANALAT